MNPLLVSGLELMLIGMGTVFVFLMLLVLVTRLMSVLITKYAFEAGPHPSAARNDIIDDELRQVIVEAVHLHRQSRGMN
jgi:oxaloacetate decarboxylase gamma subunit